VVYGYQLERLRGHLEIQVQEEVEEVLEVVQ
jgi:hypothetical protein